MKSIGYPHQARDYSYKMPDRRKIPNGSISPHAGKPSPITKSWKIPRRASERKVAFQPAHSNKLGTEVLKDIYTPQRDILCNKEEAQRIED